MLRYLVGGSIGEAPLAAVVAATLRAHDDNGDGRLDFEEFRRMVTASELRKFSLLA